MKASAVLLTATVALLGALPRARAEGAAARVLEAALIRRALPADPWFGPDKALHFSASAALAAGGYGAGALLWDGEGPRLAVGASLALGAGVAKEITDRHTGGDPSLRDLTWDVVGTATGLAAAWLLDRYVF